MHILILGAAGMVGRKLTERLLRDGRLGTHDITRMTLQDVVEPAKPATSIPVKVVASDFADAGAAGPLIAERPDVIFHLAAIVSGEGCTSANLPVPAACPITHSASALPLYQRM